MTTNLKSYWRVVLHAQMDSRIIQHDANSNSMKAFSLHKPEPSLHFQICWSLELGTVIVVTSHHPARYGLHIETDASL